MQKPPARKTTHDDHVKTALRLPPDLHAEMSRDALFNGRSLNAEILARLRHSPLEELRKENAELKQILLQILNQLRDNL